MTQTINVDVKTFISIDVETDDPKVAKAVAMRFLDALSPCPQFVEGWNKTARDEGQPTILKVGAFDDEEEPYITDAEGNELEISA